MLVNVKMVLIHQILLLNHVIILLMHLIMRRTAMDSDDVLLCTDFTNFLNGIFFTITATPITTAGTNAAMDDIAAFLHEDDDVATADVDTDDDGVADEVIGPFRFHELDNDHDA